MSGTILGSPIFGNPHIVERRISISGITTMIWGSPPHKGPLNGNLTGTLAERAQKIGT